MSYQQYLQDPRWQRKRLEIFARDDWECIRCGSVEKTLVVHHRSYYGKPWEVADSELETLCKDCHEKEHTNDGRLFRLRQMIADAHLAGRWDEVWRLCHLVPATEGP